MSNKGKEELKWPEQLWIQRNDKDSLPIPGKRMRSALQTNRGQASILRDYLSKYRKPRFKSYHFSPFL
jgi:hypothetical protein